MDLNVVLLADTTFDEELRHLLAMVALELDDIHATVLVLDNAAIASKVFLKHLEDLLGVDVLWKPFNSGQGLASISLMQTDIYNK